MDSNGIRQAQAGMDAAAYVESKKTSKVTNGKTVGSPELSEKAQKYYEQLRKKYNNYDFILVSEDKKAEAEANISRYTNSNKTVVLINTDKIEKMAEDADYRKKYEGIISGASAQIQQLRSKLLKSKTAPKVKTFGISFNEEGITSLFAVIDKSLEAQKERIKEKKEEKKAEEKKAAKEDLITVKAGTADELLQKINDVYEEERSSYVRTEEEEQIGRHINYAL